MAEAHAAAAVHHLLPSRPLVLLDDEGSVRLRLACTIPGPRPLWRSLSRFVSRTHRGLRYALHPFSTPVVFVAGVSAFVALVLGASRESWLRSGAPAAALWRISEAYVPWPQDVSVHVRVGAIAVFASIPALLILAWLQRTLLWLLLLDSSWLRLSQTPTLYVKTWFLAVRALTRGAPLTCSFQTSLPRQPIPPLKKTVARLLESARLLQDDTEYAATEASARKFLANEGPVLQRLLWLRSLFTKNYNASWWEKYVYLKSRDPLLIYSNYYVLDSAGWAPTRIQEARAAVLIHAMCRWKEKLSRQEVPPIFVHGAVPLDMNQYERMFATCRIPGREIDELVHYDERRVRHIAVACKGSFYSLFVYTRDGRLRGPDELEEDLRAIKRDAGTRSPAPRPGEACLPALTAQNRTRWAEVRETHFAEGVNKRSLTVIERALVYLSLEDACFEDADWSSRARVLLHGNREQPNVWADKSLSIIVHGNGKAGICAEHSWADALVVSHLLEDSIVLSEAGTAGILPSGVRGTRVPGDAYRTSYGEDGHALPWDGGIGCGVRGSGGSAAGGGAGATPWARLPWALSVEAEGAVATAVASLQREIDSLELCVVSTGDSTIGGPGYGKGFIKKCKVSPDAFLQAALQLAHYRDTAATDPGGKGHFVATYESAMSRFFVNGRTETCRPLTRESCAFVKAMESGSACSPLEKLRALQASATRHVRAYTDAMTGEGCDRHTFALYCVAAGIGRDSPFLKSSLSVPWRLSTSQQPQQQTDLWDIRDPLWAPRISPGGGFGPVARDGYGVSYMVSGENVIFFHVSARTGGRTSAQRFVRILMGVLTEMQSVCAEALAAGGK